MKVIYIDDLNSISEKEEIALCLGYFDGIHLGHQKLIKECLEVSKEHNLIPSLLTFDPAPSKVFASSKYRGNINSNEQKFKILESLGIQNVYVLKFDENVSKISKDDFINRILKPINVKSIICGFDFTFGYKGEGNGTYLKDYFDVKIVDEFLINHKKVSTTRICDHIINGEIKEANSLLGYNYRIIGQVVHGLKNGKRIGYPTANINDNGYVLPKKGVYACYTYVDGKKYKSMVNVGNHPTIDCLETPIIESYIFDFNEEIYGKTIEIEFIDYTRKEQNFNNLENLKTRLNLDTILIANILK